MCEQKNVKLEAEIQRLASHVTKRAVLGQQVAFSALLSHNQDHLGLSQNIRFDLVLLNDGNGYNPHSGYFTAPETGVYIFTYVIAHGYEPGQVWVQLMHNGVKVNSGVADSYHQWQDLQGVNIAIIQVNAGSTLWVEIFHQNDASLYGLDFFTSFSGALLY